MDPNSPNPAAAGDGGGGDPPPLRRPDCIKCFDALWFCYSPYYQMQFYYRQGEFDTCIGKWADLIDCLALKTKPAKEVDEILAAREREKPHIWTFRSADEAAENWMRMYKHLLRPEEYSHPFAAGAAPRPFPGLAAATAGAVPRPPPFPAANAAGARPRRRHRWRRPAAAAVSRRQRRWCSAAAAAAEFVEKLGCFAENTSKARKVAGGNQAAIASGR
uniref:Uncharacterized protein n=1 Tax=Leersia perrieri TaxID=77586 RepID=A0A0D9XFP0_9ORYZ